MFFNPGNISNSGQGIQGPRGPKGDKGDTGPQGPKGEKGDSGVMPSDMVDYIGYQHESLKAKNDADVEWLLGKINGVQEEINTVHYDGQHITATDTIEGQAKSAILKGQTLVNLMVSGYNFGGNNKASVIDLNQNKDYTIIMNKIDNNQINIKYHYTDGTKGSDVAFTMADSGESGIIKKLLPKNKIDTSKTLQNIAFYVVTANTQAPTNLMILEGDYTNVDIPYFTGMQSVQMPVLTTTGKNFCSVSSNVFMPTSTSTWYFANGVRQTLFGSKLERNSDCEWFYLPYGIYTFSYGNGTSNGFQLIAEYEKYSYNINNNTSRTISEGWYTVRIKSPSSNLEQIRLVNLQIEKGSKPTSYEPYKSNILTVNEDVTLRSNGSVCDELDLLTGKLTQRIDEDGEILTQEVVKTVDLSDNHVYSYKDVTHYDCSSAEGSLVPTLSIDVPTKLNILVARQKDTIQELTQENESLKAAQQILLNSQLSFYEALISSIPAFAPAEGQVDIPDFIQDLYKLKNNLK